jgi:hypothetical protein
LNWCLRFTLCNGESAPSRLNSREEFVMDETETVMNHIVKPIVCLTFCLGILAHPPRLRADPVTGKDVGVQMSGLVSFQNGLEFGNEWYLELNSHSRNLRHFQVAVANLLAALSGAALPAAKEPRWAANYIAASAMSTTITAGTVGPARIATSARRVVADGDKLNNLLDEMIDDRHRVDPLLVGPTMRQSQAACRSLQQFVGELRSVLETKPNGKAIIAMDAVADVVDDRLVNLEKLVPQLAKLGKIVSAATNY